MSIRRKEKGGAALTPNLAAAVPTGGGAKSAVTARLLPLMPAPTSTGSSSTRKNLTPSMQAALVSRFRVTPEDALRFQIPLRALLFLETPITDREAWDWDADYGPGVLSVETLSARAALRCDGPNICEWNYVSATGDCTPDLLWKVMFQSKRFVWAQNKLRTLLANPPSPIPATSTPTDVGARFAWVAAIEQIRRRSAAWASWCVQVMQLVSLARWSLNVRTEYLTGGHSGADPLVRWPGTPNLFANEVSLARDVYAAWYQARVDRWGQAGIPVNPASWSSAEPVQRFWRFLSHNGSGIDDGGLPNQPRLLVVPKSWDRIAVQDFRTRSRSDFDPFPPWGGVYTYPGAGWPEELGSPGGTAEQALQRLFAQPHVAPEAAMRGASGVWYRNAWCAYSNATGCTPGEPTNDSILSGQMSMRSSGSAFVPFLTPRMHIAAYAAMAQDIVDHTYGEFVSAGMRNWATAIERLPSQYQAVRPSDARDIAAGMQRAELDIITSVYGAVGGTITAVVSAINGIAGAVVGAIIAIGALVMQYAQELCIARISLPIPCPPAPFYRVISPPVGEGLTECNLDPEAAGYSALVPQIALIEAQAREGSPVRSWIEALQGEAPVPTPGPDHTPPPPPAKKSSVAPILGGAALLALLYSLRK